MAHLPRWTTPEQAHLSYFFSSQFLGIIAFRDRYTSLLLRSIPPSLRPSLPRLMFWWIFFSFFKAPPLNETPVRIKDHITKMTSVYLAYRAEHKRAKEHRKARGHPQPALPVPQGNTAPVDGSEFTATISLFSSIVIDLSFGRPYQDGWTTTSASAAMKMGTVSNT